MPTFREACDREFPGIVEQDAYVAATVGGLTPLGFAADNAIGCVGVCRDEVCQPLVQRVVDAWGEAFNFASLAGMVFLGTTGFSAAHAHAPISGGRERYVYYCMPHIGIGGDGGIGVVERIGRPGTSIACGALDALQRELAAGTVTLGIDRDDPEQSLLRERLCRKLAWGDTPSLAELTKIAHRVVVEDLERAIDRTVDESKADYAVFTGVQVHGPDGKSYVWPGERYAVVRGKRSGLSVG